jgi:hypothetical protein
MARINILSKALNALRNFDAASPAHADAKLGQTAKELVADTRLLAARLDAMATKLNTDAGVTDTNYATTTAAGLKAKLPEER